MKLQKFNTFSHDIIFVDGLWGTGKSIIAPIVSGMQGVEIQKISYIFEYLCILQHLGKLESDAAVAMLQTYSDMHQYDNLVGREVNFRWGDDSGPINNPGALRYLRRMFGPEGDVVVERINAENLALQIMSHMILLVAEPLRQSFGDRLKLIEIVRHPVYMVQHCLAYLSRFGGPREFTVSFDVEGRKLPWFAAEWHEEYLAISEVDRVIASIVRLYERLFQAIDRMRQEGLSLLVTSFERIALDPQPVLIELQQFLGRGHHPHLKQILRRQRLPRQRITHGRGKTAYGWQVVTDASEREEYKKQMAWIRASCSSHYLSAFAKTIEEYNRRWPSVLSQFV